MAIFKPVASNPNPKTINPFLIQPPTAKAMKNTNPASPLNAATEHLHFLISEPVYLLKEDMPVAAKASTPPPAPTESKKENPAATPGAADSVTFYGSETPKIPVVPPMPPKAAKEAKKTPPPVQVPIPLPDVEGGMIFLVHRPKGSPITVEALEMMHKMAAACRFPQEKVWVETADLHTYEFTPLAISQLSAKVVIPMNLPEELQKPMGHNYKAFFISRVVVCTTERPEGLLENRENRAELWRELKRILRLV